MKLLSTYLLLIVSGTSLMSGYILWTFYAFFMQSRQTDLENWSTALSESVTDVLEAKDTQGVQLIVQRYGAPANITLRVFDAQGSLLATSDPQTDRQITNWLPIPGVSEALRGHEAQGVAKGVLSTSDRIYIAKPMVRNGQLLGILRISITLEQFQKQFASVTWTILAALALTIFLCALVSDRLARSLSKPIEVMRSFAIRVGGGQFDDRLTIRQSNELDQLATELNRMSARLKSLDEERRVFLANVSHELRTPVSNVQVTIEALERGAVDELELRDRFFQTIKEETKRLSGLIHDLLDLGRLEAGITLLEIQAIALKGVISRAIRAMEVRLQAKNVAVQVDVEDLRVMGDSERLLQAFLNLLDNAIKYSTPNACIFITASRNKQQALISIRDQGSGIPETNLPRIFEQFYTTSHSTKQSGVGLGLAIAKRIIEAHGGSITANSKPGQGAVFTLSLPLES
ncbi:HAMP domain-containing sensor histidine kinase [Nodosilinea sp. FACHB-131]|uniref:sensor histidine kinase n=2 Tax=Cyanophyceae TaxID=3028117 RepID=UPI001F55A527|nr:HAMP domain-containing sensor histidine kinase [Nodosilinea sp. FACHB-131]